MCVEGPAHKVLTRVCSKASLAYNTSEGLPDLRTRPTMPVAATHQRPAGIAQKTNVEHSMKTIMGKGRPFEAHLQDIRGACFGAHWLRA